MNRSDSKFLRLKFNALRPSISASVFLMLLTQSMAEEYRLIFVNKKQLNLIETTSIKDRGDGINEAWVLAIREKKNLLNGKVAQAKFLSEIDCNKKTERNLVSVFYGLDGIEISRSEKPEQSSHVWVPDTVSAAFGRFICDPASREKMYSFGDMPLKDIIHAIYSGPWPLNR